MVNLSSYAPLFAHVDGWQWTPDMIWFDNLRSMGTPNYYVQKMYANNAGTKVVPMLLNGKPVTGQDGLFASAAIDEKNNEIILKVVNTTSADKKLEVAFEGTNKLGSKAKAWVLSANSKDAMNTLDEPQKISPQLVELSLSGKKLPLSLKPMSFVVVRVKK